MPKVLFSHQNFPAQFGGFGQYLAKQGWSVSFVTAKENVPDQSWCRVFQMTPHRPPTEGVHRYVRGFERSVINAQAFANACVRARNGGYAPDIVVAHSGWGSGSFAKAIWPETCYAAYLEWYYRWPPVDEVEPAEPSAAEDGRARNLVRNAPTLLDFAEADLLFCPTEFQAAQFPSRFQKELVVMHDGVDVDRICPDPSVRPPLAEGQSLPEAAEVIAYATRGMEPHRGFPEFMRALEKLQKERPNLHAVIGGEDRVAYGAKLPEGESWKTRMLAELDLDLSRIHFTGSLPRGAYLRLMQSADIYVYLTVPFVLSWSLIEAMSTGCAIVASDTEPVREALRDGVSARLVDHSDIGALAAVIAQMLDNPKERSAFGQAARQTAAERYDSNKIYPSRAQMLSDLLAEKP